MGPTAVSTMAVKTSGFAVGSLSFMTASTKFEIALSQFNSDKTVGNANNLVLAWADLTIGIGNLLMGANDTITTGQTANTAISKYGIFFIAVGYAMKDANEWSSQTTFWSDVYDFIDNASGEAAKREAYSYTSFLAKYVDASLGQDKLKSFLDSAALDDFGAIESIEFLKAIRKTVGLTDDVNVSTPDEYFPIVLDTYTFIKAQFGENAFHFSAPPTSANEARSDFGAFLSLVNLTPFALKANSIEANVKLETSTLANTELALKLEQDKVLTPEQIANGEQNFSDNWLSDRIQMLSWFNTANVEEITDSISIPSSMALNPPSKHFYDFETSKGLHVIGTGDEQQIIFGDDTDNGAIAGLAGDDHLYGGAGNDTLTGNNGNDYLEGRE